MRLSDFKGKIVYLDFWGNNCPACLQQFALYDKKFHEEYKDEDFVHLYVCLEKSDTSRWRANIKEFNLGEEINLIHFYTKDDPLIKAYGIVSQPHYVLIDKEGKIWANKCERPSMILKDEGENFESLLNRYK